MADENSPIFAFEVSKDLGIAVEFGAWVVPVLILIVLGLAGWVWFRRKIGIGSFELDSAEIGIGDTKVSFSPNSADRQIAYAIWVELSTRKIGLEINPQHDVISEVYDSWYNFFGVTRELIKAVPAHKLKSKRGC